MTKIKLSKYYKSMNSNFWTNSLVGFSIDNYRIVLKNQKLRYKGYEEIEKGKTAASF